MAQEDEPCVEALVTISRVDEGSAPYWDDGVPAMSTVSLEDCARLVPRTPDGTTVAITAPSTTSASRPQNTARARWSEGRAKGFEVTYWQADEQGRWQRIG